MLERACRFESDLRYNDWVAEAKTHLWSMWEVVHQFSLNSDQCLLGINRSRGCNPERWYRYRILSQSVFWFVSIARLNALPCHGRDHGFESHTNRKYALVVYWLRRWSYTSVKVVQFHPRVQFFDILKIWFLYIYMCRVEATKTHMNLYWNLYSSSDFHHEPIWVFYFRYEM